MNILCKQILERQEVHFCTLARGLIDRQVGRQVPRSELSVACSLKRKRPLSPSQVGTSFYAFCKNSFVRQNKMCRRRRRRFILNAFTVPSQITKTEITNGGSPILVVMEDTHVQEVMSLNPRWTFFHIYFCKNCNVCLKRPKINDKRGRGWPIF